MKPIEEVFRMKIKNMFRVTAFLAVLIALFVGMVGVASASTIVTKKRCYNQFDGGIKVAQGCVQAKFEYYGTSVKCSNPSYSKKVLVPGYSVSYIGSPVCNPNNKWTTSFATITGGWRFYRGGTKIGDHVCSGAFRSRGGVLSGGWYCD